MLDLLGWYIFKVVSYQLLRKHNTQDNVSGVPRTSEGGFWLALTQGTWTESILCMDLSIHHLLLHLKWVTIYAHQAARDGGGDVWTAHDKEGISAKMNSSTSVMLTKLRMFDRNLLFKCVDSFHIHETRLPCSGSCVNSSPKSNYQSQGTD